MKYENSTKVEDGNEGGYDYVDENLIAKVRVVRNAGEGKLQGIEHSQARKNTSQKNTKGLAML